MEELQDAIEDAQYVNAMTDDGPKPSKEWAYPNAEDLSAFITRSHPKFTGPLQNTFPDSLSFYLFTRYIKENSPPYSTSINQALFIEDCTRYKKIFGDVARENHCRIMIDKYFVCATCPVCVEMNESNLERAIINVSTEVVEEIIKNNFNQASAKNCMDLDGPEVNLVIKRVNEKDFKGNLFDKLDAACMVLLLRDVLVKYRMSDLWEKYVQFMYLQEDKVNEDDFALFRVLGRGGFGMVNGCKKCTSGKLYAMKVMNKKRVKMKRSEQLTLNERIALASVESPFVVNLKYAFVSDMDLFLIMDLMTGGDLSFHLAQKSKFTFPEAQYYAARIMLGCQALHDEDYVYRDLKPENILMGDDGKVKITDLGLACKITPTLHGAAGTRGYWAPEMLVRDPKSGKKVAYGHCVDWFSFGCMLAEFISGVCPFRSEAALKYGMDKGKTEKEKAIDEATMYMEPTWDAELFSPDASDLCSKLCKKNPTERLGYNGVEEIMKHPWFGDLDWEAIKSDRMIPPFIPPKDVNAASQSEIGQFSEDKAMKKLILEEKDHSVYKDWNWTNPKSFQGEVIEFLMYEKTIGKPLTPPKVMGGGCCVVQ